MFSFKNFLMATLLIFAASIGEIAEAGIITDRLPFYCYVDHKVNTYREPNGQIVGYISADEDLVRVTQVRSDGWAYGDYPISGGKRIARWFRVSELCADPSYSNRGTNVRGAQTVFRLPNSNVQFGSVSNNESVIVLADNGNRAQILYRLNNGQGYKVGWVSSSSVRNGGGNSSGTNIKGDLNNDGKVDNTDADLMKKFIAGYISKSQINISNADMDGDGEPATPADMAILLDEVSGSNSVRYAQPANGEYYIVPANNGNFAIDVPNNWTHEGNVLQIFGRNNSPAQTFRLERVSGDWYKIVHPTSGHVLNVQGGNNGNGTRLWLYHYDGTASCHWRFRDLGNGVYNIESQLASNPFLEVQNGNPFNNAILQIWQQHSGDAAKWTLKKVTSTQNPSSNSITVNLNVPYYLQKDSRWSSIMISTKSRAQGGKDIRQVGCLLTALAMKYSFHTGTNTTPDIMKNKLSFGGTNGNDLVWSSVTNLGYTYTKNYGTNINNSMMALIYRELKNGKPVIIGGSGSEVQHWVVITGYKGNSTTSFNTSDFIINDPSHSERKTLNQFITGHRIIHKIIY